MRSVNTLGATGAALLLLSTLAPASQAGFQVVSKDGADKLKLGARLQLLETVSEGAGGPVESTITIPRARFSWKGSVGDDLSYGLQTDFSEGEVELKDFRFTWKVASGLSLDLGQYKVYFTRNYLTSSSKLALVERGPTNKAFGASRDLGVTLHSGSKDAEGLTWALGVHNGTGTGLVERSMPELALRVAYNSAPMKAYSEVDRKGGPFRLSVGLGALAGLDVDGGGDGRMTSTLDALAKVDGLTVGGALFFRRDEQPDASETSDSLGFHAFASMVLAETWMPAIRYESVDRDGEDEDTSEATAGLTVFLRGTSIQWVNDVALIDHGDEGWRGRSMMQLKF